jgi:Chalcone isomerase-like
MIRMKRAIMILCVALLSRNVNALELAGIPVADKQQIGKASLLLNGAGIRSKNFFDIYICSLYLTQKQTTSEAIFADEHERRILMHFVYSLGSKRLYNAFKDGIEANHSPAELAALTGQIKQMEQIFDSVAQVNVDDVITIDYLPAVGTRISLNATTRGIIPGAEFYRALLRIWLGNEPVQRDLKKAMLGG